MARSDGPSLESLEVYRDSGQLDAQAGGDLATVHERLEERPVREVIEVPEGSRGAYA